MTARYPMKLSLGTVSLFLDLDGTLAPLEAVPDAVGPDIERNVLIRQMAVRLDGRLAVVSGRALADIDRILEGTVVSLAGSHGLQRRDARLDLLTAPAHPRLETALREVATFAAEFSGVVVEDKPLSVALHYRTNPDLEGATRRFAADLAHRTGLKVQHGHMVVELLSPGMDKGRALRAFMMEPPFVGTIPVFVGDDLTDEDGFKAVQAFGGFGVLVGPVRETHARYRLDDVPAVHAWLSQALVDNYLNLEVCIEPTHCRV